MKAADKVTDAAVRHRCFAPGAISSPLSSEDRHIVRLVCLDYETIHSGTGGRRVVAQVLSGALVGVECVLVRVEVSVTAGLPTISVVGLPHGAVREGRDRVRAALQAVGYTIPPRRITVNLAPADVRKEGSGFDLPLALGLIAGAGHIPPDSLSGTAFVGELGLNGEIRSVPGVLPMAAACREGGIESLVVPRPNEAEAAAVGGDLTVLGAGCLSEVVAHLQGRTPLSPARAAFEDLPTGTSTGTPDLMDVRGNFGAKRALEVAAAGGHHILLVGAPGCGKTMLARRLPGILPSLSMQECRAVTTIHSVAGLLPAGEALIRTRPFRSPHHTISRAGLVGGGVPIRPGEVSLAHCGVLFLDELPEFTRTVLETLRQPLEDGWISVIRARDRVRLPARFTLVAAMNPCPCGYMGSQQRACTCDPSQVARYRSRVSGPLRDRIDLHVSVPAPSFREMRRAERGDPSRVVRERVERARTLQRDRQGHGRPTVSFAESCNAALGATEVRRWCRLDRSTVKFLEQASDRMGLSARGVHRVLKVARTIADLDGEARIQSQHLAEALQYRESEGVDQT